jgi:hypothetical protein
VLSHTALVYKFVEIPEQNERSSSSGMNREKLVDFVAPKTSTEPAGM